MYKKYIVRLTNEERAICEALPTIGEKFRRPASELLVEFEKIWPAVLGALLDAVSVRPDKKLTAWPKAPRALSWHLRRIAPILRKIRWDVVQDGSAKSRALIIRPNCDATPRHSAADASAPASSA